MLENSLTQQFRQNIHYHADTESMIVELTLTIVTIQCHKNAFIQLHHYCAKHLRTITIADQILHWETLLSTFSLIRKLTLYTQNVQNSRDAFACFEILQKAFFISDIKTIVNLMLGCLHNISLFR